MKHEDKFLFFKTTPLSYWISERSSVVYLLIVDMHADTIKAMSKVPVCYTTNILSIQA